MESLSVKILHSEIILKTFTNEVNINNPLKAGNPKTGSMAYSIDPHEMLHSAAFHQGLHCLLIEQNQSSEKITVFKL